MDKAQKSKRTITRSPCASICALNEDDVCIGCYRTSSEIARWSEYDDDEVKQIFKNIEKRYKEYEQR